MSSANFHTLNEFIEKVKAGDLDGAFVHLSPDVIVHEADGLPYPGSYRGPDGFRELLGRVFGLADLNIVTTELIDGGDTIVARMQTVITFRAGGGPLKMPITELYTFVDGKITYVDVFYKDTKAVADLYAAAQSVGS